MALKGWLAVALGETGSASPKLHLPLIGSALSGANQVRFAPHGKPY